MSPDAERRRNLKGLLRRWSVRRWVNGEKGRKAEGFVVACWALVRSCWDGGFRATATYREWNVAS